MAQQYLLPHGGSHHIVEQKITPKALIWQLSDLDSLAQCDVKQEAINLITAR